MFSPKLNLILAVLAVVVLLSKETIGIKCYQCSSGMDPKGEDNCGAYKPFDKQQNIAVECNSEDSKMPGTFCVKITRQGPRGFVWDGRWRQVIRKCASISSTGVTNVCNWGVDDNGDYWQECTCSGDGCNSAPSTFQIAKGFFILITLLPFAFVKFL